MARAVHAPFAPFLGEAPNGGRCGVAFAPFRGDRRPLSKSEDCLGRDSAIPVPPTETGHGFGPNGGRSGRRAGRPAVVAYWSLQGCGAMFRDSVANRGLAPLPERKERLRVLHRIAPHGGHPGRPLLALRVGIARLQAMAVARAPAARRSSGSSRRMSYTHCSPGAARWRPGGTRVPSCAPVPSSVGPNRLRWAAAAVACGSDAVNVIQCIAGDSPTGTQLSDLL